MQAGRHHSRTEQVSVDSKYSIVALHNPETAGQPMRDNLPMQGGVMMLKNRTAIVTGGTRGIGLAIVKKYLENGADEVSGP